MLRGCRSRPTRPRPGARRVSARAPSRRRRGSTRPRSRRHTREPCRRGAPTGSRRLRRPGAPPDRGGWHGSSRRGRWHPTRQPRTRRRRAWSSTPRTFAHSSICPRTDTEHAVHLRLDAQGSDDACGEIAVAAFTTVERPGHRRPHVVELDGRSRAPASRARRGRGASAPNSSANSRVVLGVAPAPRVGVAGSSSRSSAYCAHASRAAGSGSSRRPFARRRASTSRRGSASASSTSHASMPVAASRPPRRPSASKLPANTPRRSKHDAARASSSSEYDQSTVARSVWWRSTAVRRPPVSRRKRSSRRAGDLGRAHRDDARRGELDRERDAVEPAADLGDRGRVRVVERERRPRRVAPARRTAATASSRRRRRRRPCVGDAERAQRPDLLARRRRVPPGSWRGSRTSAHVAERRCRRGAPAASSRCSQLSSTSSSCFAPQELDDAGRRASTPGRGGARRASPATTCDDRVGVARRPRARRTTRRRGSRGSSVGGDLEREPGLADAADAGERDEPRRVRARRDRGELVARGRRRRSAAREVAAERVERAQRREVRGEARRATSWKTRSGVGEVAQPVLAEVDAASVRRRSVVAEQLLGGERHDDLPAVRDAT